MSKYDALWEHIQRDGRNELTLSFEDIGRIAGVPLDHSFLNYKKELLAHGYCVGKISIKAQAVVFRKIEQ
jgi:hypothetical protein